MNAVTVTFTLKPKNSRCCYLFVVVEFLHSNPQQSQWRVLIGKLPLGQIDMLHGRASDHLAVACAFDLLMHDGVLAN